MPTAPITPLHPKRVTYRDHVITLTHRPRVNDWQYHIEHTRTIVLSNIAPRYDAALKAAKQDIDIIMGKQK
jgi:hypothetical protein